MSFWDLFFVGIGLSMDAFAVSVCKGLSVKHIQAKHILLCGVYFGAFQALMPTIGYFLGSRFSRWIMRLGGWVAFALLGLVGLNMIRESFGKCEELDDDFHAKAMLPLAVATSIDALAVGVSFAAVRVDLLPAVTLIGCTTCVISSVGVVIGAVFGARYRSLAERAGGAVLILIGIKILLESLGML